MARISGSRQVLLLKLFAFSAFALLCAWVIEGFLTISGLITARLLFWKLLASDCSRWGNGLINRVG